jgi:hypothetical protein
MSLWHPNRAGLKGLTADAVKSLSPYDLESLYNAGVLSIDDIAKYVNSVGSAYMWAHMFYEHFTSGFVYSIISNANISGNRVQSILYNIPFSSKLIDIITYGASDLSVTSNTTISGVNRYGTLTVNSGVTLTVGGQPGVLIVKSLNNSGTIAKSPTGGAGGSAGASGAGVGGQGGGGLIIFVDTLVNSGVISADGANGGNGSTIASSGYGGGGGSGLFVRIGADAVGVGGQGGGTPSYPGGAGGYNGGGGGSYAYIGGAGDGCSYTSYNIINSLLDDICKAVIDWFISNVLGKSLTTSKSLPNIYGSGGGGGAAYDGSCAAGGGGGGGGEIIALVLTLNNTGTVRANGGNGGNGGNEGSYDAGGGGGGGGIVYVLYKSYANLGTLQANGGGGGGGDFSGSSGSAGTAKAIQIII